MNELTTQQEDFVLELERDQGRCEICGRKIPENTGGFLDDLSVCDSCYERGVENE